MASNFEDLLTPSPPDTAIVFAKIFDTRSNEHVKLYLGTFRHVWDGQHTIGCSDSNFLQLNAPGVAPVHYIFCYQAGLPTLHPAEDTRGTQLQPIRALTGVRVSIGPFVVHFEEVLIEAEQLRKPIDIPPTPVHPTIRLTHPPSIPPSLPPTTPASILRASEVLRNVEKETLITPDTEMARLSESAKQWVLGRLDEHHGAIGLRGPNTQRVYFERAYSEFRQRWFREWADVEVNTPGEPLEYLRSLDELTHSHYESYDQRVGNAVRCALNTGVFRWWFELNTRRTNPEFIDRNTPFGFILYQHICFILANSENDPTPEEPPNPWAPLWAMWERGIWPVALPNNGWCIYVPVFRDEILIAEAPQEITHLGPSHPPQSTPSASFSEWVPIKRRFSRLGAIML